MGFLIKVTSWECLPYNERVSVTGQQQYYTSSVVEKKRL